jgi:hypothetical protein
MTCSYKQTGDRYPGGDLPAEIMEKLRDLVWAGKIPRAQIPRTGGRYTRPDGEVVYWDGPDLNWAYKYATEHGLIEPPAEANENT